MNLLTNSKFISFIWWLLTPILVALLLISAATFFLEYRGEEGVRIDYQKSKYLKSYPRFLDNSSRKIEKTLVKKISRTQRLGKIDLQACYTEKDKNFIVFKDGSKTIFLDLGKEYKDIKLIEVGINFAVFLKNGQKLKLELEETKSVSQVKKSPNQSQKDEKYIGVPRSDLRKYTQNLGEALKDIRIQELKNKKKFAGVRLSFIRKGSLFDKMKLRVGDVIKSIDGIELKSMMDLLPYYNRINDTATLQVGFERNNEMKEIIYEIN